MAEGDRERAANAGASSCDEPCLYLGFGLSETMCLKRFRWGIFYHFGVLKAIEATLDPAFKTPDEKPILK